VFGAILRRILGAAVVGRVVEAAGERKSSRKEAQEGEASEKCHWEEAVQVNTLVVSWRPGAAEPKNRTQLSTQVVWRILAAVW
jgi:hypothetical protein